MSPQTKSQLVKQIATELGFGYCGIAQAAFLEEEAPRLENWLRQNRHGKMAYMENHFDKRLDPRLLVEGAKSVISLLYNYYPKEDLAEQMPYKIAKYAYGEDYHFVIREILNQFLERLRNKLGQFAGRGFVDSAPVMERVWAEKAGLGWIGKNTLLLNPKAGSFYFLAELITDLELEADPAFGKDLCGSCRLCVEACPTDALTPYSLDANRCISYLTIELKEAIPDEFAGKMQGWVFGCDICQDVCPWNRRSRPHQQFRFEPHPDLPQLTKEEWQQMSRQTFERVFKKSAVKRTGLKGLLRNVEMAAKTSPTLPADS